ncbi:hypothetical protein [Marinobacter sp.]|uniref:hypothetical protein n=1 Tax=Marinobacter sp. TaxID=50741 RepID=UPI0034A25FA9
MTQNDQSHAEERRKDLRFSVSANRGQASHRVRYVENGGAAVDTAECTFCQAVPDLEHAGGVKATEVTARRRPEDGAADG